MAELLGITQALEMLRPHGFTPLQRLLLGQPGTLQSTLAAFFNREVGVRVVRQWNNNEVIHRRVQLYYGDLVVCHADSILNIFREDVRLKVLEQVPARGQVLGLGQILETLEVRPSFTLLEVNQDEKNFWRTYDLEASGFCFRITEVFRRALYLPEEAYQTTLHAVTNTTSWDQIWSWLLEEDHVPELQDRRAPHSSLAGAGEHPWPGGPISQESACGYSLAGRSRLPGASRVHH